MKPRPIEIKRQESKGIYIKWSDGTSCLLPSSTLRRSCPCAVCLELRGHGQAHEKPLTAAAPLEKKKALTIVTSSAEDEFFLTEIWGVGNYAIGLAWRDGHKTGIYTFEYLRQLTDLTLEDAPLSQC